MEGEERANIEARVQCLLDIQTLLNAAMLQIQQYLSVTGPGTNRLVNFTARDFCRLLGISSHFLQLPVLKV